jgi:hypothetical protein
LKNINGLKLIYEGQYVSLWEYESGNPVIFAAENISSADIQNSAIVYAAAEPLINFQQVDSSTYRVNVVNASQPFYLIFSETYNPSWQVYEGSVNWFDALTSKPFPAPHLIVNTYGNAWYIDKTGTFSITLYYTPQSTFFLSSIVTFLIFTGCIAFFVYKYAKNKFKR